MARLITEECRVLTGSLHTVPEIHRLFKLQKCDWMAQAPRTYSEEIVREFYASYTATLRGSISKRTKPTEQDPFTSTMVPGCLVHISRATISRFLYSPITGYSWSLNITQFDYRWDIMRGSALQRNGEQREAVKLWSAKYIVADGEHAEWVTAPRLGIQKAKLNFVAKFFWLLVRNRVLPTKAKNQLIGDKAVMVVALVAGLEIDFARMLQAEIHEWSFRTSTTYPFPCWIFQLFRDFGVPIWHCDRLIHPIGTMDIGLIRDGANVATPRRESQVEVPPLGADHADTVEQAQGGYPIIQYHTDNVPISSSQVASRAPSSSKSIPPSGAVVVPLTRTEQHIQAVHKRLDPFELRVLARPALDTDLSSIQAELACLRADVNAILEIHADHPDNAPTPDPIRARGERHRSCSLFEVVDDARARKRERKQEEQARRASILDEELRQRSMLKAAAGASSSVPVRIDVSTTDGVVRVVDSTTDGVVLVDAGTTEGDPSVDPIGYGKPDPPAC
uniref:Integrase core domain containing protein n=1 Tax=Solanum tuberosum TaxID=4113 RepID=M1D9T7_SOLTU